MGQKLEILTNRSKTNDARLLPLTVAAVICFVIGVTSGFTAWYLFDLDPPTDTAKLLANSNRQSNQIIEGNKSSVESRETGAAVLPTQSPSPALVAESPPVKEKIMAPAGELQVEGGEVVLGGSGTGSPIQRKIVDPFAIAETEVTIGQFREFLEATKDENDLAKNIKLPRRGRDNEPVTEVNWIEAREYCKWLGEKIGAEVRLPTEAEWELAARGKDGSKYPWGNNWIDDAAESLETKGRVRAVKSFPSNKSWCGAYDMAGNVWEWTVNEGEKYNDKSSPYHNETTYVIKGGSAEDEQKNISAQARDFAPKTFRAPIIGFRYVVIRSGQ